MKAKIAETDLAAVVVRHFLDLGAEVYQEVAPWGSSGARADVVAVLGPVLHVIETKANFGLSVIDQALYWRDRSYAHRVSVAVPFYAPRSTSAQRVCETLGIGVYGVKVAAVAWEEARVEEVVSPALNRRAKTDTLAGCLTDQQKAYAAAGNSVGKFWSPFKATCEALREIVEAEQGLTWREALKRVKHHYASDSSAASNLFRLATTKNAPSELSWLECSNDRPARLYLAGQVPPQKQATIEAVEMPFEGFF